MVSNSKGVSRLMTPPQNRPTARQLAAQYAEQPMQIAGKPADVCPYCGCVMFAYRTTTLKTRVMRYEQCRNPNCQKKFLTRQAPAEIVREINSDTDEERPVASSRFLKIG